MAVRGLEVRDRRLVLHSNVAPKLNSIPRFLQERIHVSQEQIKVEPAQEEILVNSQLIPLAEELIKFFAHVVYPDTSKVEKPESVAVRSGRRVFNLTPTNSVLVVTYSRWNGNPEEPVFYRGRWVLNPVRAFALAKEIIRAAKQGNFTYKLTEQGVLIKDGDSYKVLDIARGTNLELTELERVLFSAAIDSYILSGGTGNFSGKSLGKIRIVNADTFRIGGTTIRITTINKALMLKELIS
jgi:hypothetical protein